MAFGPDSVGLFITAACFVYDSWQGYWIRKRGGSRSGCNTVCNGIHTALPCALGCLMAADVGGGVAHIESERSLIFSSFAIVYLKYGVGRREAVITICGADWLIR